LNWIASPEAVERYQRRHAPALTENEARKQLVELAGHAWPVRDQVGLWSVSASGVIFSARMLGPEHYEITSIMSRTSAAS